MSTMTFPFGYKDYNDAHHNGVCYTQSELQNVKNGDKVIILTMTDSDDDYSLENRLFEETVDSVRSDGFNAGGFWVDLPNFNFEYFLVLHPKHIKDVEDSEDSEDLKPVVIGDYSTKDKFIEFIGGSNNVNFLSKEAYIEGKQLSGLDFDGIKFKLTICDEGTVNFEEVGSSLTTSEQRGRLLELISEKNLVPYRQRWCVREIEFESVQHVKGKPIPLFLSVEYQRPIDRLASIFDESSVPEINQETDAKLDILMSLFGDDVETVEESEDCEIEVVEEVQSYQTTLEASFAKMKQEKIDEIKSRISQKEKDVRKFEMDVIQSQKKVEDANSELKLLEDRLETLQPVEPFNGYYFNVSERQNEKVELEPEISELILSKVKKVKGINAEAFMKLFENGEYHIRLGLKEGDVITEVQDYESLPEAVKKSLGGMNIRIEKTGSPEDQAQVSMGVTDVVMETKLKYVGELSWGQIVQKMIKLGFGQESSFDKMCGSNSFESHIERKEENRIKKFDEASVDADGNLVWDDKQDDWDEDMEEMYGDIKDDDFIFAIYHDEDATNEIGDPKTIFCVNPLSYGKNIAYDQHLEHLLKSRFPEIKALGDGFEEIEEGSFDIWDEETETHWSVEQIVDFLCKIGIKPSIQYQKHCSDKDLQLLTEVVNKLGHQNSMLS